MEQLIIFSLSLAGLWIGAEFVIRGSLGMARYFGLSESFIGLIILALGTDLPEIMVSITGAREQLHGVDASGIIIGNVIGSNMSNMVFVLGSIGLLGGTMTMRRNETWREGLSVITATVLFLALATDGVIARSDGLAFLATYLLYFVIVSRSQRSLPVKRKRQRLSWYLPIILLGGIILLSESSTRVIDSGIAIAANLGVSQIIVGALLVGVGTSLPELVVSIKAAFSGASELSIGNLIGSNIINILLALGVAATISDIKINRHVAQFDLSFLLLTTVVVVLFMLSKRKLERKESLLMLMLYGVYITLKLMGW